MIGVCAVNDESKVKVTDKRMFTPDGQLREEYRFLDETTDGKPVAEAPRPEPAPAAEPTPAEVPPSQAPPPEAPPLELPGTPEGLGAPGFLELVSILAEPVAIYLGDLELPDGGSAENLEMARFYIDLLDVLRQKTAGRLTAQESAVLEDTLYRLRVRYVQKRG